METLLSYDNVEFYCFINDREIVTNLNNYMDLLHFSADVNAYICNSLIEDNHKVTKDNYKEVIEDMRTFSYQVTEELVIPYEDLIMIETTN